MKRLLAFACLLPSMACAAETDPPASAPPMVVVTESEVMVREAPPHGAIGMSTAYRISDAAPTSSTRRRNSIVRGWGAASLMR